MVACGKESDGSKNEGRRDQSPVYVDLDGSLKDNNKSLLLWWELLSTY